MTNNSNHTKQLHEQMKKQIIEGGNFDQVFLYLEKESAEQWLTYAAHPDYSRAQDIPFDAVVTSIEKKIKLTPFNHRSIEILSLACGHAPLEKELLSSLFARTEISNVQLHLFDICPELAQIGVDILSQKFADKKGLELDVFKGDFYQLPSYTTLIRADGVFDTQLVVCMLGYTFSNLDNEERFLQEQLSVFREGTLLLLDIGLVFGLATDEESIHNNDPWLCGQSQWKKEAEKFWAVPFINYHPHVNSIKDIRFVPTLENRTKRIEGSYVIEMQAYVGEQRLVVQRYKRYTLEPFIDTFQKKGWNLVQSFPFFKGQRVVCLFERKNAAPPEGLPCV